MSGHSTYEPKTGIERWLDARLPIMRFSADLMDFPTPKNLNYWWTFGGILAFCLVTQIVTGVILAMHYIPSGDGAFNSVQHIMRDVNYGWLIRYIHANGASMFFLAVYIHMFRGIYYGSFKAPREVLWLIGATIYVVMMATAFFGYVLPWGQMSFWAAKVITNLFGAIPVVGPALATWLWGGFTVDAPTLNRFYLAALPAAVHHRGAGRPAHLGAARARQQQPDRRQCEEPVGHGAVPPLLHGQGRLRGLGLRDHVRDLRVLHARGDGARGQQHPGQPARRPPRTSCPSGTCCPTTPSCAPCRTS